MSKKEKTEREKKIIAIQTVVFNLFSLLNAWDLGGTKMGRHITNEKGIRTGTINGRQIKWATEYAERWADKL